MKHPALLLLALGLGACAAQPAAAPSTTATTPTTVGTTSTTSAEDAAKEGSVLACRHFRNVMADVRDHKLTADELRGKLVEVDGDANIATPAVRDASAKMLAAATADAVSEFNASVGVMDEACKAAGH